jgi:hypothetical protein
MIYLYNMTYKASWDNATKIITIAITILFLAIMIGSFIDIDEINGPGPYFMVVMIISTRYAMLFARFITLRYYNRGSFNIFVFQFATMIWEKARQFILPMMTKTTEC